MRSLKLSAAIIFYLLSGSVTLNGQPIPVEVMIGHKYGLVYVVLNRSFSENSRFGFFHLNTVQFDFKDKNKNGFIILDQLYVETIKNLRITGGVAYTNDGFNPTAGLQYVFAGKKLIFVFAPRINFQNDPTYDIKTILQYKPEINDHLKFYTRLDLLNVFDSNGNIKSYQWIRLGLDLKGTQFGFAADFDEYGPNPSATGNFGIFLRKEIF